MVSTKEGVAVVARVETLPEGGQAVKSITTGDFTLWLLAASVTNSTLATDVFRIEVKGGRKAKSTSFQVLSNLPITSTFSMFRKTLLGLVRAKVRLTTQDTGADR